MHGNLYSTERKGSWEFSRVLGKATDLKTPTQATHDLMYEVAGSSK